MLLFVYGSLKEGFPNFHVNKGRRVPGRFMTVEPYPLYLADGVLPCLLPRPGDGLRVVGQLFEVDDKQLAAMDELERVGHSGGYARITIDVRAEAAESSTPAGAPAAPIRALVYVQAETRLQAGGAHIGPIDEYTEAHARALRW